MMVGLRNFLICTDKIFFLLTLKKMTWENYIKSFHFAIKSVYANYSSKIALP